MSIINSLLEFIVSVLAALIPSFGVDQAFMSNLDTAITFMIGLFESVSYFIPLDVWMLCWGVMFAVDNFSLLVRLGLYILKLIRG